MQLEAEPARPRQLITLTPLIDVVFILLLFFMLASSFLEWRAIRLDMPVQTRAVDAVEGGVLLRLRADGSLDVNGRPVTLAGLGERLAPPLTRRPDRPILIQPEAGVPVQRIVSVLDGIRAAGGENVSLTRN